MSANPRGSVWHRWDPHLHAPGTLLSDQFNGDWDSYFRRLTGAKPPVEALGVTDYFCIRTYREVRRRVADGALPQVRVLFPNVEMRLNIGTDRNKGINLHLLFSPEDPSHEGEIERLLSHLTFEFNGRKYSCTHDGLLSLGRAFEPNLSDDLAALRAGANQFKADLSDVRDLCRDHWFRRFGLVAVAGSEADGTAGLQHDASMAATRLEIERLADIIFSGTPQQRNYWLGKHPGHDRDVIEEHYGSLKPCLQGSDAHRIETVGTAPVERYCWIKGDLAFESLRQAVLEPEERVSLGEDPPEDLRASVAQVAWSDADWLEGGGIDLNPGLVTVIGPRGSGKTALVDLLAAGSGALQGTLSESSFLWRASTPVDRLAPAQVKLLWQDGSGDDTALAEAVRSADFAESTGTTCYLSQHFVERLCSADGLAVELRREMERVVFDTTDPLDRQEAADFEELVKTLVAPLRRSRQELVSWIDDLVERIDLEGSLIERLPQLRKQAEDLRTEERRLKDLIRTLMPKGAEERTKALLALEEACSSKEKTVETLRRQRTQIDSLAADVRTFYSSREPAFLADLQRRYLDSVLTAQDWSQFHLRFSGDVERVIATHKAALDRSIAEAETGAGGTHPSTGPDEPLSSLRARRDEARKVVGIDAQKQKEYQRQQSALAQNQTALRSAEAAIKEAEGADGRRSLSLGERRAAYRRVIETIVEEERVLQRLYDPLKARLQGSRGALARIEFFVRREVELDEWVARGEALFDLRRDFAFKGHGALADAAREMLLPSWQSGTADEVAVAMDAFLTRYRQELPKGRPLSIQGEQIRAWRRSLGEWMYATDQIRVEYGIRYAGVAIEQLSPGTRGIVLLLLFLAVDQQDQRPLIVDQPEENLDPKSVFDELVPHFREARKRRQVIVVTHNANLVVNTDADQVIVAQAVPSATGGLPQISYTSGSLENPAVRSAVCQLLEGGERAFLEREKRYRLRWRE